jgi:hypothetical protein
MHGGPGIELLFFGGDGGDTMFGGDGGDLIIGEANDDRMYGDEGNDLIFGFSDEDCIFGGPGTDRVWGGNHDDAVYGEADGDYLHGNRGNDILHGGGGEDTVTGNRGDDQISGGAGADKVKGNRDDDNVIGEGGQDKVYGNRGSDFLDGGDQNDKVRGGDGPDVVYGCAGTDDVGGGFGSDDVCDDCCLGVDCCPGEEVIPESDCGEIRGLKWEDENGNGEVDAGEVGLPGWTIYIDENDNVQFDPGEPSTLTLDDNPNTCPDETGRYALTGVLPDTHTVREVLFIDWEQTFPGEANGDEYGVIVDAGDIVEEIDFGNRPVTQICGTKWDDFNGNGVRDEDPPGSGNLEPPLGGVTVFLDLNGNGVLNAGEPSDLTDATGRYCISGLQPDTYTVCEVPPADFYQTFPPKDACHTVVIVGEGTEEPYDFGNAKYGGVTGRKWDDINGNRVYDAAFEGPIGNVLIYVDYNDNGSPDPGEPSDLTDPNTGRYEITEVPVGTHKVREVEPAGYFRTFPFPLDYHLVTVPSGTVVGEYNFGNRLP